MIRPGWQTTEFWTTLIGQVLSLLALLGLVHARDQETLQDALGNCVAAVFVLLTNAWVIIRYIQSRTDLKQGLNGRSSGNLPLVLLPWLALALLGTAAPLHAAPPANPLPARASTCFLRGGHQRDDAALLALMHQMIGLQQQTLANQQMILALLQQQQRQAAPILIQGQPLQELPGAGKPKQDLPIAGPPRQDLPEPGPPRQELPEQGRPRQELPVAPSIPPATSRQPLPMQRYTVIHTLWPAAPARR